MHAETHSHMIFLLLTRLRVHTPANFSTPRPTKPVQSKQVPWSISHNHSKKRKPSQQTRILRLTSNMVHAATAWFWVSNGLNRYSTSSANDFLTLTRRINGGSNGTHGPTCAHSYRPYVPPHPHPHPHSHPHTNVQRKYYRECETTLALILTLALRATPSPTSSHSPYAHIHTRP